MGSDDICSAVEIKSMENKTALRIFSIHSNDDELFLHLGVTSLLQGMITDHHYQQRTKMTTNGAQRYSATNALLIFKF